MILQRLHTRDVYECAGIGLAVVKRIVEKCSGRVMVMSTPVEGSTFVFALSAA